MQNKFFIPPIISLGSLVIVNLLSIYRPFWQPFERKVYDAKYFLFISEKKSEDIVIVDIDENTLKVLGRYQNWPRAYFAEVINYLNGVRVLGLDIFFGESDTLPLFAHKYYSKPNFDSLLRAAIKQHKRVVLVSSLTDEPIFQDVAETGIGEVFPDGDGVIRRGYFCYKNKKSFAARVALMSEVKGLNLKEKFLIYYLAPNSFRRVRFSDVYLQRVPKEYFKDKIVLIGGTAPGLFDFHPVPFKSRFPGIEIQANLVNDFINNLRIVEFPYIYILVFTLVLTFTISLLTIKTSLRIYACGYILIFLILLIASSILFKSKIEFGIIRPYYTFILAIVISLIYRYRFEEKEKRRIKSIFSRYYSKELLEKVLKEPPKLGGEKVFCTILFADIRNFTPYAEKSSPETVAGALNKFLTEMVMSVFKYRGRVDKFIGDCVMAVFGHPVKLGNSALNACLCAQEMVKKAKEMKFQIGVGINSGEVVSGNFGSPMRMEYTVIGDAVNLASRLEGLTKEYGVDIIVGEATYKMLEGHPSIELPFRKLKNAQVKGKEEEIAIYGLCRIPTP